jgi:hypothetical protein
MPATFASLWPLSGSQEFAEPTPTTSAVRTQTAIVRTLADALERDGLPNEEADDLRWQLLEELSRLSSCIRDSGRG